MKKLQFLKALLDFFWFFSLLGGIGIMIISTLYLFDSNIDIPIEIQGQVITTHELHSKLIIFANMITGILFLSSIYLLRKVVTHFQKKEIFNRKVIKHFNIIGQLIIVSSLINNFTGLTFFLIKQEYVPISFGFGSYDSFLISISLGLFFMVISEVFKIAKNIKEENELTI